MYDLLVETVKVLIVKPPWWITFFAKVAGPEFIPAILLKRTSAQGISYMVSAW